MSEIERTDVGSEEYESSRAKWERWNEDAKMALEDEQLERSKRWQAEDTQDALDEFYEHIESLPVDEAIAALEGLRAYQEDILKERDITEGRIHYE